MDLEARNAVDGTRSANSIWGKDGIAGHVRMLIDFVKTLPVFNHLELSDQVKTYEFLNNT
jgi:hypothetical protein